MKDDTKRTKRHATTRRSLLRMGAGTLPLVLAGCAGQDPASNNGGSNGSGSGGGNGSNSGNNNNNGGSGGNGNGSDSGSGQVVWKSFASNVPADTQFNMYNPKNQIVQGTLVHWAPLMQYHVGTDQWIPMIASDWSMDGTTATLDISDQFTWHNGDPVTAEDVGTKLKLEYYMEVPLANYLDGPPTVGDGTVELPLSSEVQESIFWPQVTANDEYAMQSTPTSVFGKYVERFEDAGSDSATNKVQSDLLKFVWQDPKSVVGNGPFEFVEANSDAQVFKRFDDYPVKYVQKQTANTIDYDFSKWPDKLTVDRIEFVDVGDLWASYRSGTLDGGASNAPKEVYSEYPQGYRPIGIPRGEGWGLTFNYNDEVYGEQNIRQALGHLVDTSPPLPKQMFAFGQEVEYQSGMSTQMTKQWVSKDVYNNFTNYSGKNTDKANQLLEDAGFSKSGGKWKNSEGDPFKLVLKLPNYDDIVAGMQVVEGRLKEFGINIEFNAIDTSSFYGDVTPNGDFEVIASSWGNQPHPLYAYQGNWLDQPAKTNYNLKPQVPPIGKPDADPSMTVDIKALLTEMAQTTKKDRIQEIIDKLAWAHNQDMPYVMAAEKAHQYLLSYDDWEMPEVKSESITGHDPVVNLHAPWAFPFHVGTVRPK